MNDKTNTIAGWVLFGGIVALGLSIVTGMYFKEHRPETMGYVVEGVEAEGGAGAAAAVKPLAFYLANATVQQGEAIFKKCAACHTANQGGANGIGPNLWGTVGKPHGHIAGFAYSDALKGVPGSWDFEALDKWLTSPKAYAPGTKMSFAGLGKPEDRAAVIVYLNSLGSNLPLPPVPAEEAAEPAEEGAEAATDNAADANATAPAEAAAAAAPAAAH